MSDQQPEQCKALLDQALKCYQESRFEEAERLYAAVVGQNPAQAEALHMLGVIAYTFGRLAEAGRWMEESLRHNPSPSPSDLCNYAILLAAMERHDEAIPYFERAIALQSGFFPAHGRLGYSLLKAGRPAEAVAWCERCVTHSPGYGEGYYFLGEALSAIGRRDEAIASFRQALLLRPASTTIRALLGNALNRLGHAQEALAAYRLNLPAHGAGDNSFRREGNTILRDLCHGLSGHVLSIGSGSDADKEGRLYREYFINSASYFRLDNDAKCVPDIVGDIQDLRDVIADDTYDVAFSIWALEHVPDVGAALAEIHRIVKPGGYFVFGLPLNRAFHSFPHDYHRFTLAGIRELFQGSFVLDKVYSVGQELPFVLDEGLSIVGEWTETAPAGYVGLAQAV